MSSFTSSAVCTHMSITDVDEWGVVVGFEQLEVEKLAIKEVPGTTHVPWDRGAYTIISKDGMFQPSHEDCSQLYTTAVDQGQLEERRKA